MMVLGLFFFRLERSFKDIFVLFSHRIWQGETSAVLCRPAPCDITLEFLFGTIELVPEILK